MNDHRKWPLLGLVSLGIGIGTVLIAGRSLAHVALKWQFLRKANVIQKRLKERLENPLPATTIVTRISEWEEIHSALLRYKNAVFVFLVPQFFFQYLEYTTLIPTFFPQRLLRNPNIGV